VFDVRFCAGSVDVFVSCGADGSVRMFDLRSLEHSTIIYEPAEKKADGEKGTLCVDSSMLWRSSMSISLTLDRKHSTCKNVAHSESTDTDTRSALTSVGNLTPRFASPSHLCRRQQHHPHSGRTPARPSTT
jgi:hypothetical protein